PRPEPLREIPGLKKRERTWKDEVRERVRDRKRNRGDGDLPLFRDGEDAEGGDAETMNEDPVVSEPTEPAPPRTPLAFMDTRPVDVEEEDAADLPLRPAELPLRAPASAPDPAPELRLAAAGEPTGVRT